MPTEDLGEDNSCPAYIPRLLDNKVFSKMVLFKENKQKNNIPFINMLFCVEALYYE